MGEVAQDINTGTISIRTDICTIRGQLAPTEASRDRH